MSTKTFTRVFLLALVAVATACGSSSTPNETSAPGETSAPASATAAPTGTTQPVPTPAPGETANAAGIKRLTACKLLTQAEAIRITGVSAARQVPSSSRASCAYYDSALTGNICELYIEIPFGPQLSLVRTSLAGQVNGTPNIVAVPGIGDAAYDYSDAYTAGLAFERTGIVIVILSSSPGLKPRSGAAQLADIVQLATSIAPQI